VIGPVDNAATTAFATDAPEPVADHGSGSDADRASVPAVTKLPTNAKAGMKESDRTQQVLAAAVRSGGPASS
jgi:hypothetical protein